MQTKTKELSVGGVLQGEVTGLPLMEKPMENLSWAECSFLVFSRYTLWPICNVLLDGAFNLLHSIPFVLIKFCNGVILMYTPLE